MKKLLAMLLGFLFIVGGLSGCTASASVKVDFSEKDGTGVQYLKKYDGFSSTWSWMNLENGTIDPNSLAQIPALEELRAELCRVDLFMGEGGIGKLIGKDGRNGTSDEEFRDSMSLIRALNESNLDPFLVYFANPEYSQTTPGWKTVPDLQKWEEICKNIAFYYRTHGIHVVGHEIWNEPDLSTFFSGSWDDYIDTYIAGAKGIKDGDPDAMVGGLSAALVVPIMSKRTTDIGTTVKKTDFERFVEKSAAAGILPDFISWHYFGRELQINGRIDESENFNTYLNSVRSAFNELENGTGALDRAYPELETVQQYINEFNIFEPYVDDVYMTQRMVPGVFDAISRLNSATDVASVSWAAFMGDKSNYINIDLVDGLNYRRYPAYYALWMYARLPVDKVRFTASGGISAMAGACSARAGVILWNGTDSEKKVDALFQNLPFDKGSVTVYVTDSKHPVYITKNEPVILYQTQSISLDEFKETFVLEPDAAYYVEINKENSDGAETEQLKDIGDWVRTDFWYKNRGDNKPYADYLENSMTAYLGMSNEATGVGAVSAVYDGMEGKNLKIKNELWGAAIQGGTVGFKIDFEDVTGYQKSILYAIEGADNDVLMPFGGKKNADEIIPIIANGETNIDLATKAPSGWTGRICISFIIKDAGVASTAKFSIRE